MIMNRGHSQGRSQVTITIPRGGLSLLDWILALCHCHLDSIKEWHLALRVSRDNGLSSKGHLCDGKGDITREALLLGNVRQSFCLACTEQRTMGVCVVRNRFIR